MRGSPPLVRERLSPWARELPGARITPARAGKTGRTGKRNDVIRDHPRSCGKDSLHEPRYARMPGITPARAGKTFFLSLGCSSLRDHPRSCGKDCHELRFGDVFPGITPARAGKTRCSDCYRPEYQDHPRSCGKDPPENAMFLRPHGSPPLVRERLSSFATNSLSFRITPARAGKTAGAYREHAGI